MLIKTIDVPTFVANKRKSRENKQIIKVSYKPNRY